MFFFYNYYYYLVIKRFQDHISLHFRSFSYTILFFFFPCLLCFLFSFGLHPQRQYHHHQHHLLSSSFLLSCSSSSVADVVSADVVTAIAVVVSASVTCCHCLCHRPYHPFLHQQLLEATADHQEVVASSFLFSRCWIPSSSPVLFSVAICFLFSPMELWRVADFNQ